MKNLLLISVLTLVVVALNGQEMTEAVWLTGEENTKIETFQRDGLWYGKIVSSDNSKAKIGKEILQDFVEIDGEWKGKLYAAKKDKLMNAVIIPSFEKLNITVSAGLFKKKLTWTRVNDN